MKLSNFDYELPEPLIAQFPLHRRDQARLMVVDRAHGTISHDVFYNLDKYLPQKTMLIVNDSKVIPARLLTKRQTGGEAEFFLLKQFPDGYCYEALMRPTRRLKIGEEFHFPQGIVLTVIDKANMIVRFNQKNVLEKLQSIGHIPLPPYIRREDTAADKKYYQTVYAKNHGSVAAPTAGLHFTNRLLSKLKRKGHDQLSVTLHVSYGTFKPVEEEDIKNHKIHSEEYFVSQTNWNQIIKAKEENRKIISVGTTSCRVLEAVIRNHQLNGHTNIFLYPGCQFNMIDGLITNFHLPKSTLLMLVYAFGGMDLMRQAYQEAIKERYRFFSYGDGMLII